MYKLIFIEFLSLQYLAYLLFYVEYYLEYNFPVLLVNGDWYNFYSF